MCIVVVVWVIGAYWAWKYFVIRIWWNFFQEFNCSCTPKFSGHLCEERINLCENHPCVNNGTCLEAENGPSCICAVGFTGPHCQVDVDDCLSSQCENNSTCVDGINEYMCECRAGISGINCEFIDHCYSDPCENAATCVSQSNVSI